MPPDEGGDGQAMETNQGGPGTQSNINLQGKRTNYSVLTVSWHVNSDIVHCIC